MPQDMQHIIRSRDDLDRIANLPIDQIQRELSLDQRAAYELRREATAEVMSEGAPESLQGHILKVLKNGTMNGIQDLREALSFMDVKHSSLEITKAVWGLQKRNMVTFYERKHAGDSILTKIKLTRNGMKEMGVIPSHDHTKPDRVKPSRELKRPSPVGTDYTEAKNQPAKTNGGPIERVGAPKPKKPEVIGPVEYAVPETPRYSAEPPLPQNMKPFIDEAPATSEAQGSSVEAHSKDGSADTHTQYPDLAKYPLMAGLKQKAAKLAAYERAALELDGFDEELALSLLEKIQLTDLEKEVCRFLEALGA